MNIEYVFRVEGSDIFYTPETNGGGDYFFREYYDLVAQYYGKVDHLMEWCSGPGFIGYGMMACNLCDKLTLLDKFKPSIDIAKKTAENSFPNTKVYHSDNLSVLPDDKIDLVVGNPPHFENEEDAIRSLNRMGSFIINDHLRDIILDPNWDSHRDMFNQLSTRLSNDGIICLQLHSGGSSPDTFKSMVEESGMRITATFDSVKYGDIYYMEVRK